MTQLLNHTPLTATPGTGPALSAHLRRYDDDVYYDEADQGPFAKDPVTPEPTNRPVISDPEMFVPPTVALYDPSSASLGDIVGRTTAPYFDAFQRTVRGLLHREPPRIYTTLPTAEEIEKYSYVAPPTPLTWQHYAAAGLATTALAAGCTNGSSLGDTIVKAVTLNLAGGLAIFLYGMKQMSDGVKASSGETLKNVIGRLAGNRFSALGVGTGVTSVIQSSSVTSVLTLGLVNAGVMSLAQALGVIAGANIGTTMTAWLMSTGLSKYGLAMIGGAGLTYLFSNKTRTKEIAKTIMGLGMVFHGLKVMSAGFKNPEITHRLTDLFSSLNDPTVGGLAMCMLAGAGVTAAIQSSSATVVICIALAAKGIIPFEAAAGIALGANVGTTITAWLATPGSTTDAKRVAVFHTGFNVGGALLVLPWSPQFAAMAKNMALYLGITSTKYQISFVHTLFNVGAAALFLPFVTQIKNGIVRLIPEKASGEVGVIEEWQGRFNERLANTPGAAVLATNGMVYEEMVGRARATFDDLMQVMVGSTDPKNVEEDLYVRERELDGLQHEVYTFFPLLEQRKVKSETVARMNKLWYIAGQIESLGDRLVNVYEKRRDFEEGIPDEAAATLIQTHTELQNHFGLVCDAIESLSSANYEKAMAQNKTLKEMLKRQTEAPPVFPNPTDQRRYELIMESYRELLGHLRNIAESIAGKK